MSNRVKSLLGEDEDTEPQRLDHDLGDWAEIRHGGVGVEWLAGAFGMDRRKVKQRIAGVKPLGMHKTPTGMRPVYSLREVAGYLCPRPEDLEAALKNMTSADLPSKLQKDVWDAKLKELQWRERAGELWRSEDVAQVLGETFMAIKSQVTLWVDQIEERSPIPPDVRERLVKLTDALQKDIHNRLVAMPARSRRKSVADLEGDSTGTDNGDV